jgi:LemA protein
MILVFAVVLIVAAALIALFNNLIKARNLVQTAFSDIDVHLTKRFSLVPNLVSMTKGYAQYESDLLLEIVENRSGKAAGSDLDQTAQTDAKLTRSLNQLKITVENYPDLKANQPFLQLMNQLTEIEDHLVYARRFYNGTTRVYNTKIQSFPSNLIARMFAFQEKPFYEIERAEEREVPTY